MAFTVEFSQKARDHLRSLRKRDQRIIIDAVVEQLIDQPDQPTTHRKPLETNTVAPWELRVGDFRVFYDVQHDSRTVLVVAVGQKTHNRLTIDGEEIDL